MNRRTNTLSRARGYTVTLANGKRCKATELTPEEALEALCDAIDVLRTISARVEIYNNTGS